MMTQEMMKSMSPRDLAMMGVVVRPNDGPIEPPDGGSGGGSGGPESPGDQGY